MRWEQLPCLDDKLERAEVPAPSTTRVCSGRSLISRWLPGWGLWSLGVGQLTLLHQASAAERCSNTDNHVASSAVGRGQRSAGPAIDRRRTTGITTSGADLVSAPVGQEVVDRSAEEQRISTTRYASSSSDTSTRLITTLVVEELTWEYSGSLRAETIKACARAAIRDLRGSISPEALPEMAVRLAKVRLAETAADVNTPSPAKTAWESTPLRTVWAGHRYVDYWLLGELKPQPDRLRGGQAANESAESSTSLGAVSPPPQTLASATWRVAEPQRLPARRRPSDRPPGFRRAVERSRPPQPVRPRELGRRKRPRARSAA